MKTMTKVTTMVCLAVLITVSVTLSSCKKDGSNSSNSAISLLTSSRWTFEKFEYQKPDGTWITDFGHNRRQ